MISKNKRTLFYAFVTTLGLGFAIQMLKEYGVNIFLLICGITSALLLFEIYMNWRYATKILRQIDMPVVNVYNLWGHIVNHITLPLMLFFSVSGFVLFNNDDLVRILALVLLLSMNIILLINIRSYYRDEFNIEVKTRYVYDLIKLIVFFFGINLILHLQIFFDLEVWIAGLLVCFLGLCLFLLVIYMRGHTTLKSTLYAVFSSFIIAVIFMLVMVLGMFLLGVNVLTFLCFYFSISVLHHRIERTLTFEVFMQYILILVLGFILFFGLS